MQVPRLLCAILSFGKGLRIEAGLSVGELGNSRNAGKGKRMAVHLVAAFLR